MKREHIWKNYEANASKYWKLCEGGYATPVSVRQGENITFRISNSRSYYDIFIFYEGAKRKLVKEITGLSGRLQNFPNSGTATDSTGRKPFPFAYLMTGKAVYILPTLQRLRECGKFFLWFGRKSPRQTSF